MLSSVPKIHIHSEKENKDLINNSFKGKQYHKSKTFNHESIIFNVCRTIVGI